MDEDFVADAIGLHGGDTTQVFPQFAIADSDRDLLRSQSAADLFGKDIFLFVIGVGFAASQNPIKAEYYLRVVWVFAAIKAVDLQHGGAFALFEQSGVDGLKNALCSVGDPSAVNGGGPWSWTCGGLNGGASVASESRRSESGVCGTAHG